VEASKENEIHLIAFVQKRLMESQYPSLSAALADTEKNLKKYCSSVQFIEIETEKSKLKYLSLVASSALPKKTYTLSWLHSRSYKDAIKRTTQEHNFDAAYFGTISLHPYKKLTKNIPSILDHHNIESHMLWRRGEKEKSFLKRLYFQWESKKLREIEQSATLEHQLNTTCSDLDKERLREIQPSANITTIPNGVDTKYFTPSPAASRSGLIFVGGLSWYPNLDAMKYFLREIWPVVSSARPHTTMTIVGRHSAREAAELSLHDPNVTLTGFVDDVREYINKAAVYVCPIRDGGGTKLKILDAMSMAIPIVCDPIAAEGISVNDNIDIQTANQPNTFAEKIIKLLDDSDERDRLGRNARNLMIQIYDYEKIGIQFRSSLKRIARK
jgi:glycosyltransferase involved in cell wall biosynthesis